MTKIKRLYQALDSGEALTAKQIRARFGIANPSATVFKLRTVHGAPVEPIVTTDSKGRVKYKYKLRRSVPAAVVAAGYAALAGELF